MNLCLKPALFFAGELFDQIQLSNPFPIETARFYAAEIVLLLEYLRTVKVCIPSPHLTYNERIDGPDFGEKMVLHTGMGLPFMPVKREVEMLFCSCASSWASKCTLQVVHGDLKPENLLLNSAGHLKLIDFGSASEVTPMDAGSSEGYNRHLKGTADYTSPEVSLCKPHSE